MYWGEGGTSELNSFIVAALRTWQALTMSYRDRAIFSTVAATPFYDLISVLPTQYSYNVTDADLVALIQAHLLEPQGIPWVGSNQFTLAQIVNALQTRRNQFLRDTGMVVTHLSPITAPAENAGRVQIPDNVIAIRRAAWGTVPPIPPSPSVFSTLFRSDEWAQNGFSPGWNVDTCRPLSYSVAVTPPVSIQLSPVPDDIGKVHLCVVQAGPDLNPATPVLVSVPDDFTQYVMFGALADLLGADGQCRDPQRATYCEQRYQEGVAVGKIFPGGLLISCNGLNLHIDSVSALDSFNAGWENTPGTPWISGWAGRNLVALSPVPDGIYSIAVDSVRNMPVPVVDGDYLQVGREYVDTILDYAQHLASFKMGGQEFQNTQAQFNRFVQAAGRMNQKLKAEAFYSQSLAQTSILQKALVPMETQT